MMNQNARFAQNRTNPRRNRLRIQHYLKCEWAAATFAWMVGTVESAVQIRSSCFSMRRRSLWILIVWSSVFATTRSTSRNCFCEWRKISRYLAECSVSCSRLACSLTNEIARCSTTKWCGFTFPFPFPDFARASKFPARPEELIC